MTKGPAFPFVTIAVFGGNAFLELFQLRTSLHCGEPPLNGLVRRKI